MDKVKLLPCAFCERSDLVISFDTRARPPHMVRCVQCGTRGPLAETSEQAIAAWNTRPTLVTDEVVERVAKALFKAIYPTGTTWEDWERHVAAEPSDGFDGRERSRELARKALAAMPAIPPQSLGDDI